jgi:PAS domain S-box-containing protein
MPQLLQFDFGRAQVWMQFMLPALINLAIFIYIMLRLAPSRINFSFGAFVILAAMWQLCEALMRMSISHDTAEEWYHTGGLFTPFVLPFGILFVLFLTGWYRRLSRAGIFFGLFVPAAIVELFVVMRMANYDLVPSAEWHWLGVPRSSLITNIVYGWMSFCSLVMLAMIWSYFVKIRHSRMKRRQAILLALGFTAPLLGGLLGEILSPLVLKWDEVPLTAPLFTVFSVFSLLAILRYRLLEYSPERQWDRVMEMMNEGVLIVNMNEVVMYANAQFCNTLGYEFGEIRGMETGKLFFDKPEQAILLQRLFAGHDDGSGGKRELQMKTKRGEKIWVLMSTSPYRDTDGKIIGSIGIMTVTDQLRRTEAERQRKSLWLNEAIEAGRMFTFDLDLTSGMIRLSENARDLLGLGTEGRAEYLLGPHIHPDDRQAVALSSTRLRSGIVDDLRLRMIHAATGKVIWLERRASIIRDEAGNVTGLLGLFIDITERKEAEAALQYSESRLKEAQALGHLGNWSLDFATGAAKWSDEACRIYGFPVSKKDHSFESWLSSIHPDDRERVNAEIKGTEGEHRPAKFDHRIIRPDGTVRFIHSESRFTLVDGKPVGIYGICLDITEQKLAEESLVNANKELQTFIYKASHDLRGPVSSIIGLVNVARMDAPNAAQYICMIGDTASRLEGTLEGLLKSLRMKDVKVGCEQVELNGLLNEVFCKLRYTEGFSDLDIRLKTGIQGPVLSNREILDCILQNMIENAVKFRNRLRPAFLDISITNEGETLVITFTDNGIGMSPEIMEKIFEMYFRGSEAATGSGLGLYLVKTGVACLGGSVSVKSTEGEGSRFIVRLPHAVPVAPGLKTVA